MTSRCLWGCVGVGLLAICVGCGRITSPHPHGLSAGGLPVPSLTTQITMVTSQVGWAESTRGLWRITSGGQRWTPVLSPGLPPSWPLASAPLDTLGSRDAWIGGPVQVYATTDGGRHWTAHRLPPAPHARITGVECDFLSPAVGYVLRFRGGGAGVFPTHLWKTTDGGQHWVSVGAGPQGLQFQTSMDGWGTVDNPVQGQARLAHTTNGGRTWTWVTLPLPVGASPSRRILVATPRWFSARDGWTWATFGTSQGFAGVVYTTLDGGSEWHVTTAVPDTRLRGPKWSPHWSAGPLRTVSIYSAQ